MESWFKKFWCRNLLRRIWFNTILKCYLLAPAVLCGYSSNVHKRSVSQLLPHRALGECFQRPSHQVAAAFQLDKGRDHLPERTEICTGEENLRILSDSFHKPM